MKKRVTILGSTGSIGMNTLRVIRDFPGLFTVTALAAGSQADLLARQVEEFRPESVFIRDEEAAKVLQKVCGNRTKLFTAKEGIEAFCASHPFDILVAGSNGTAALGPVMGALKAGRRVALANKEILIAAGSLIMELARNTPGAELIPVDSEHSAIFQCLHSSDGASIHKIILTGSGGPLREIDESAFQGISKETVTSHPKWKMGKKISVDSATLMNKGLEVIEAGHLFDVSPNRVEVLIHPEALVHSMVEFRDGSILAQLGVTDMRLPIQYALCYPERFTSFSTERLDLKSIGALTFSAPDAKKFPCLGLSYEAARKGGTAPCVLAAADETAVAAFLDDKIDFTDIPRIIEEVLSRHRHIAEPALDEILTAHEWALEEAARRCAIRPPLAQNPAGQP